MGASTVIIVLAAVLGVVYGLDLTKTESYYKNEAVVKSGDLIGKPTELVDTSTVSKSTSLVNQKEIVSSVSSNPTKIVSDNSVFRTLAKRCHCNKEKPEGCKGGIMSNKEKTEGCKCGLMKNMQEKSCSCSKSNGMKTREIMEKESNSKQEFIENCKTKEGGCKCGGHRERHGCHSCMKKGGEERRFMKDNQGKPCMSDKEKEEFLKLNKNKLSSSSYNEEMKRLEIQKLGKQCGLSDVEIQNDINKSKYQGDSTIYKSSYQSSGNKEILDKINKMRNQGKLCNMSEKEKEEFMKLNRDTLSSSSYSEETKRTEIIKLGKECGLSDAEIQNEIIKMKKQQDNQTSSSSSSKTNEEIEMENGQILSSSSSSSSSSRSSSYKSGYDQYGNQIVEESEIIEKSSSSK